MRHVGLQRAAREVGDRYGDCYGEYYRDCYGDCYECCHIVESVEELRAVLGTQRVEHTQPHLKGKGV